MKISGKENPLFHGSEIWDYLNSLSLQTICSYDARVEEFEKLIYAEVIAHVPKTRLITFKKSFIQHLINEDSDPDLLSQLEVMNEENLDVLFQHELRNELRKTLVFCESLLAKVTLKYEINLSDILQVKRPQSNPIEAIHQLIENTPLQFITSHQTAEAIIDTFSDEQKLKQIDFNSDDENALCRLCVTEHNIQMILDSLGENNQGYEIQLNHPKLGEFYHQLDEFRLHLTEQDHQQLFQGKKRTDAGPFCLNRALAPELFRRAKITLTHDQIREFCDILPEEQRQRYFSNEGDIQPDTFIKPRKGTSSLALYQAAAKTKNGMKLTPLQNRQLLSQLTLEQLHRHDQLSYRQGADTVENTLTSGGQYLSSHYAFSASLLTQIISTLSTYTLSMTIVLAGGIAFLGSITLGLTAAIQSAMEASRKEARIRLQHIHDCLTINTLRHTNNLKTQQLNHPAVLSSYQTLLKLLTAAGLAEQFQQEIAECDLLRIENAFKPEQLISSQMTQLNGLTDRLRLRQTEIEIHLQTCEQNSPQQTKWKPQREKTQQLLDYLQKTQPKDYQPPKTELHTIVPTAANLNKSTWFNTWIAAPWRKFLYYLKPKSSGFTATTQALFTGFFITAALLSMAYLITSTLGIVLLPIILGDLTVSLGIVIATALSAVILGIVTAGLKYKSVIHAKMMDKNEHRREKDINAERQEDKAIDQFKQQCLALLVPDIQKSTQHAMDVSQTAGIVWNKKPSEILLSSAESDHATFWQSSSSSSKRQDFVNQDRPFEYVAIEMQTLTGAGEDTADVHSTDTKSF